MARGQLGRWAGGGRDLVVTRVAPQPQPPATPIATTEEPHPLWERVLDAWRMKLQSETTRATYSSQVRAFFRVPGVPDLGGLDVDVLDAYSGHLRFLAEKDAPPAERLAPATVNLKLAALRSFLTFCRRRGWLPASLTGEQIADGLQGIHATVQRPYQVVEGDELGAMLDAAGTDAYDASRALSLVGLALGAGLRVAELCALDVGDLASDATGTYLDVRLGKGRKQRQVPISPDVYELVLAYLTETGRAIHRTADRATPLLLSRKCRTGAGRLTTRQARRIIVATARRAGVGEHKRITPHALRHSYALRVLEGDAEAGQPAAPLPAVSKLLGHASVSTTGRYLAHFERREVGVYAPALRHVHAPVGERPSRQGT